MSDTPGVGSERSERSRERHQHTFFCRTDVQITGPDHWFLAIQLTYIVCKVSVPSSSDVKSLQANTGVWDVGANNVEVLKLNGHNPTFDIFWIGIPR